MTSFYKELNEEIKAMVFGGKKVEKYTISEYFESCKKSKFKKHIDPHPLELAKEKERKIVRLLENCGMKNGVYFFANLL